jgi:hypothetical protein
MTIFETEEDRKREQRAIETFVSVFGGSYKKLDPLDIDYKVFDKDKNLIAYVEVKGRIRTIANAYPLCVSVEKLVKLMNKRLNPVILWACEDGIIYAKLDEVVGMIKKGGRSPREGSFHDVEMMAYYDKQKGMKYVRYS